MSADINVVFS